MGRVSSYLDLGAATYDIALSMAEVLIDQTAFFDGRPETVLGILLLVGVVLLFLR